jgi:hypothetical protein
MKTLQSLFAVVAVCAAGFAVHGADKAAVEAHYLAYHTAGKALVEAAINKKVDPAEVGKKVDILVTEGTWFVNEYAKAYPKGEKLLKVIVANLDTMKKLSFKELEHEWHDLHHFDKADKDTGIDLAAEENEHFTDPIHTVVHPLLVLKAAQDYAATKNEEALKSMKEEMEEGLEQVEKQKAALLK